jgi:hypothetical protein
MLPHISSLHCKCTQLIVSIILNYFVYISDIFLRNNPVPVVINHYLSQLYILSVIRRNILAMFYTCALSLSHPRTHTHARVFVPMLKYLTIKLLNFIPCSHKARSMSKLP